MAGALEKPRILVVDDSKMFRSLLLRLLEGIDAVVVAAEDGAGGLSLTESQEFDLIVTDIEMPGMNGFEFCERLKQNPATRSVPIVILSTTDTEESIEKGFYVGASAYVVKSSLADNLIPRIRSLLRRVSILKGRSVLLVDDSEFILKSLADELEGIGLHVFTARDGMEALHLLESNRPDIIVSDVRMPNLDGGGLCEAVRKREDLAQVPFVVMSSENDRRAMLEMIHRGASAYMVKPFAIEQLVILAERLLSEHFSNLLKEKCYLENERSALLRSLFEVLARWESRDKRFAGHTDKVTRYAMDMGAALGFNAVDMKKVELTARLHNIGIIQAYDAIVFKTKPLSPEELAIIRQHPTSGAAMIQHAEGMSDICAGILHHHEKMDGSGYPNGLRGDSIPLLSRIIAVADTYVALTSDRPHRNAYPQEKALQIISDAKGNHLCPRCVDALLTVLTPKPVVEQAPVQPAICIIGADRQRSTATAAAGPGLRLADASVLLVDNNPYQLNHMKQLLRQDGVTSLLVATDGKKAWDCINEKRVDIVICEVDTPSLSGIDLLDRVRKSEAYEQLPFVLATFNSERSVLFKAVKLRVSDYIVKPCPSAELLGRVKNVLTQSKYMRGLGEGKGRKAITVEEYTDSLVQALNQMHNTFIDTVVKRYRFYIRSVSPLDNLPDMERVIDECSAEFGEKMRHLHSEFFMAQAVDILNSIMHQEAHTDSVAVKYPKLIVGMSRSFIECTKGIFKSFSSQCLHSMGIAPDDEQLQSLENDYNACYRNIIVRKDIRAIEIFNMAKRYKELCENSSLDDIKMLREIHTPKILRIESIDTFGRGLLEPIDIHLGIKDCQLNELKKAGFFPRIFCKSILEVIKMYMIGVEKYQKINAIFQNKVSQFCGVKGHYEYGELHDFFTQTKIKIYIASQLLYILKMLIDEQKRSTFLSQINHNLKNLYGDNELIKFDPKRFEDVVQSWAVFVNQNVASLKSPTATLDILRHYIVCSGTAPGSAK